MLSLFQNKRVVLIYYAVLALILMSWTNIQSAPPMPIRIFFLILVIIPGLSDKNALLVSAIMGFWAVSIYGYAYSYMPTMTYLYAGIFCLFALRMRRTQKAFYAKDYRFLIFFLIYVTLINLLNSFSIEEISYSLFIICMIPIIIEIIDTVSIHQVGLAFMLITVVLSIFSMTTQNMFIGNYGEFGNVDRSVWADPNYLAILIGMGGLVGLSMILDFKECSKMELIFSSICFGLSVISLFRIASRGAFLCLLGGGTVLLCFRRIKIIYKILIILAVSLFVWYLYNNSFFDLILTRMEMEDGTGTGRTIIWQKKLSGFFQEGTVINYFFGMGLEKGSNLGFGYARGFHNDFIAFFVCYGIVGLLFVLKFLLMPLKLVNKNDDKRCYVYALTVYLILACITLEPLSAGRAIYYFFWFYILLIARSTQIESC